MPKDEDILQLVSVRGTGLVPAWLSRRSCPLRPGGLLCHCPRSSRALGGGGQVRLYCWGHLGTSGDRAATLEQQWVQNQKNFRVQDWKDGGR